ncbi:hypothetical protein DFP72DRAFT_863882 [Ephemerocybe angulata]|uniref:Uncharacterized protein n=1 Tax=Ephemerocybe angulata TaxID=980116 RepID=A0A8H6H5N6_9AGAR|nr:hypothetical protein DFP72DRAFT_863882 [Tulosesus angulatus]
MDNVPTNSWRKSLPSTSKIYPHDQSKENFPETLLSSIWATRAGRLLERADAIVGGKRLGDITRCLHIPSRGPPEMWRSPALPDVIRAFPNLNTLSLDFRRYLPVPRPWDPLKTCLLPYPAHLKRLQLDEAPSVDEVAALSASLPSLQFLGVHRVTSQSPPTTTTLHFPALTHLALGDHTFYHRPGKEYGVLMAALAVGGSMPKLETLELLHYSGDPRPLLERFGKQLKSLSYPTRHDDEEELEVPLHLCPDIRTLKLFPYTLVRIHTPMRQLTTVEIVTTDRGRRTPSEAANQLYEQVHRPHTPRKARTPVEGPPPRKSAMRLSTAGANQQGPPAIPFYPFNHRKSIPAYEAATLLQCCNQPPTDWLNKTPLPANRPVPASPVSQSSVYRPSQVDWEARMREFEEWEAEEQGDEDVRNIKSEPADDQVLLGYFSPPSGSIGLK